MNGNTSTEYQKWTTIWDITYYCFPILMAGIETIVLTVALCVVWKLLKGDPKSRFNEKYMALHAFFTASRLIAEIFLLINNEEKSSYVSVTIRFIISLVMAGIMS